jgi:hypothetical protein
MFRLCHSAPRTISPFVFLWLSTLYSIGRAPTNHGSEVGKSSRAKGTTFNIEMRLRHHVLAFAETYEYGHLELSR